MLPALRLTSRKTARNRRKTTEQYDLTSEQEHPPNLSISISGGKETNKDSPSNGE